MENKKVILIVRDGWGYREDDSRKNIFNAIKKAKIEFTDRAEKEYPTVLLNTSGLFVGLPEGYVGNSEVGHITIGSGQIIKQSLGRIKSSIENNDFLVNKKILKAIQNVKENDSQLHLMILMQDAGVHSHIEHLFETIKFCEKEGLKNDQVVFHLITDGRDEKPDSGIGFLAEVAEKMEETKVGNVGTISGRYFAMDRNNNNDRTEKYFQAFYNGNSQEKFSCGMEKINYFYEKKITDEFLPPMVKEGYEGVSNNDSILFLNFRKDRAQQITKKIEKEITGKGIFFLTMTRYYGKFSGEVIFDDEKVEDTLGDIMEKNNKKQLRISETEKYAHITFFFDGGVKKEHKGKKEILIDSPDVERYDTVPEMSSVKLTEKVIEEIKNNDNDFILINFPNGDMVGHTGNIEASVKAVEAVDKSCQKIWEEAKKKNYILILTADHGNAEEIAENMTTHTKNKVPFTILDNYLKNKKDFLKDGDFGLANIAPTVLELMGIEGSKKMKKSLIK